VLRDGIQLSEAITGDGATIIRHACGMDLEGIVSKRRGSRYVSGRTRAWLKTKNPNFQRRWLAGLFALVLVVVVNVSTPLRVTAAVTFALLAQCFSVLASAA
jgi:hypothetical protein